MSFSFNQKSAVATAVIETESEASREKLNYSRADESSAIDAMTTDLEIPYAEIQDKYY